MRPQVQALIQKLRDMKVVQEVGVPEEIIWDMAFYQLHRKGQEVRLAQIASRLTALWVGMVKNEQGQPAYIFGTATGVGYGGNTEAQVITQVPTVVSPGDSPPVIDLDNADTKRAVADLIKHHVPKIGSPAWMIKCTCGRDYAHEDEWANHVRVRIWRELKNVFPPIGGDQEGAKEVPHG